VTKDKIGGTTVEILPGTTSVYFTGGHSEGKPVEHEMGTYNFWTLIGEDEYGEWICIARGRDDLPAVDRFQRMDTERLMATDGLDRVEYQTVWDRMPSAKRIRPSSIRELTRWIDSHKEDSAYASAFVFIDGERHLIPRRIV